MLDLTDEQIDEAARYEAMRTVREEARREAEERAEMIRRGCEFIGAETCNYGEAHRLRVCDCEWLDTEPESSALARAWEAAGGEGQVVS